jgi:alkylation response protein AidB-like acyl-CoA dehydrogenase
MDFSLSEEQELLQHTVRSFVAKERPPQEVRAIFDGERQPVPALWKGLAEIGIAGLVVPEAHGGIGFSWEYDVRPWFKRVTFDRLWLGAPELHRERFAAIEGW